MAYTTAQVDALKRAIATGALTVRKADGSTVTYRSLDEMRSLLADMEAEANGAVRTRTVVPVYSRGL